MFGDVTRKAVLYFAETRFIYREMQIYKYYIYILNINTHKHTHTHTNLYYNISLLYFLRCTSIHLVLINI